MLVSTTTTTRMGMGLVVGSRAAQATWSPKLAPVQRLTIHTTAQLRRPITPPPSPPSAASPPNVSARPTAVRSKPLPRVPNTLPFLSLFIAAALASWAGFTVYATNKEKLSSSIFKSVLSQVKSNPEVSTLLGGQTVMLKRETWLGGMARVKGAVNMMQGRVDLSFRIHSAEHGEARSATVYFTSIRAHKHAPFEILRFVVVDDTTGHSVSLLDKTGLSSIDVESGDIV